MPSVRWYMDDKLLDETYQQTFEGVVKNDLTIRRLERVHTQSKLRCLASNNNLTRPVETSLQLKMLCKFDFFFDIRIVQLKSLLYFFYECNSDQLPTFFHSLLGGFGDALLLQPHKSE